MEWIRWFIHWLPEIAGALTGAGIIYAVLMKIYTKFIKPDLELRRKMQMLAAQTETLLQQDKRIREFAEQMNSQTDMLTELVTQMRPNGGSSMLDILRGLESRIAFLSTRQRILYDEYKIALFHADADGRLTYVSPAYGYMVSRSPEDILGDGWKTHIADGFLDLVDRHWEQAIEEQRDFRMPTIFINARNGRTIAVEMKAAPVKNDNRLYGFV